MNNDNNKLKTINRVVTPIKLDSNGAPIKPEEKTVNNNQSEVEKKEIKKVNKEHDSSTMIFVVVLLIILACIVGFLFYYLIPRYVDSKKKIEYNDKEKTTVVVENNSTIATYTLSEELFINTEVSQKLSDTVTLSTKANGNVLNVYLNEYLVAATNQLYSTVGIVDETVIIAVKNNAVRTTKLMLISTSGQVVKEYYNFGDSAGFTLMDGEASIIITPSSIIAVTSRINKNNLILKNDVGVTDGINVCDESELSNNNINGSFMVLANFSLKYEGKNKFSEPNKTASTDLHTYIFDNDLCQ